jgi:organic hydroperoxide reductase OsmC/OhrA
MMGTFGGALEARKIDAGNGRLTANVVGEVEKDDGVLVVRRIHVALQLIAPEEVRETVERVHGMYAMRCPLYRTIHNAIELTSSYTLTPPGVARDPSFRRE